VASRGERKDGRPSDQLIGSVSDEGRPLGRPSHGKECPLSYFFLAPFTLHFPDDDALSVSPL
jgi:hypothetical protein